MDVISAIYVEDSEEEALVMQLGMRRQQVEIIHFPDLPLNRVGELVQPPNDAAAAIILDALLPSASGIEIAQTLRDTGDTRLIVLLTAGENPDADLLDTLNVYYMSKPPSFSVLAELIRG
jgi:DNA-binding response OmpR family regulator